MLLAADTNNTADLIGWGIGVVIWILLILGTVSIARKKGRSAVVWESWRSSSPCSRSLSLQ